MLNVWFKGLQKGSFQVLRTWYVKFYFVRFWSQALLEHSTLANIKKT